VAGLDLLATVETSAVICAKGAFFVFKLADVLSRLSFLAARFALFYLELLDTVEEEITY